MNYLPFIETQISSDRRNIANYRLMAVMLVVVGCIVLLIGFFEKTQQPLLGNLISGISPFVSACFVFPYREMLPYRDRVYFFECLSQQLRASEGWAEEE